MAICSFKPYYNWNTFNTKFGQNLKNIWAKVLNLIITGIPSIHKKIAFLFISEKVLNLIITGIPSILLLAKNVKLYGDFCFKPYYNWNTFNTVNEEMYMFNLVSFKPYYNWNTFNTGGWLDTQSDSPFSFKPYYNWNTFNTLGYTVYKCIKNCFKPYYNWNTFNTRQIKEILSSSNICFKPYYNWNTFNTKENVKVEEILDGVLNLIITGIPSIPKIYLAVKEDKEVLNLIITGIPSIQKSLNSCFFDTN